VAALASFGGWRLFGIVQADAKREVEDIYVHRSGLVSHGLADPTVGQEVCPSPAALQL
jgi:cold shock CspA family protein